MNELELRERFALRAERTSNAQARRLCAVSSKACRMGDPGEWLDLEHGARTYCFCAAHALAAELGCSSGGFFHEGATPEETIARIRALESRR